MFTPYDPIRCGNCRKRKKTGMSVWACVKHRTGEGVYKNARLSPHYLLKLRKKAPEAKP